MIATGESGNFTSIFNRFSPLAFGLLGAALFDGGYRYSALKIILTEYIL